MSEIGIHYQLESAGGALLNFNGFPSDGSGDGFAGNYLRLEAVEGLDFPGLRTAISPRALLDGSILHDSFRGERYPSLVGTIVADPGVETLALENSLRTNLNNFVRADGMLRWRPRDGTTYKRATVRLWEPLQIGGVWPRTFRIGMIAPDPYVYSDAEVATQSAIGAAPQDVSITNSGNAETRPRLLVQSFDAGGALATGLTAVTVTNVTTGASMRFTGGPGGSGFYFDMATRKVYRSDNLNMIPYVDWALPSTFWNVTGTSTIRAENPTYSGTATQLRLTVYHRHAWVG